MEFQLASSGRPRIVGTACFISSITALENSWEMSVLRYFIKNWRNTLSWLWSFHACGGMKISMLEDPDVKLLKRLWKEKKPIPYLLYISVYNWIKGKFLFKQFKRSNGQWIVSRWPLRQLKSESRVIWCLMSLFKYINIYFRYITKEIFYLFNAVIPNLFAL